ncbi:MULTISPECIES: hypothetical protein [Nocardiopsis]|uniref:Uncharacterized protein n=1 Tax=Nocardiopsis sinuspersici TaxID=501010 RepID=A0A7Y9XAG1_9ACTN|nr:MULTISPECIES: hypothetical protein [Nocardiopsis]NYH51145.1 hypothetical protein [Nocardiopsis sinuspersici]
MDNRKNPKDQDGAQPSSPANQAGPADPSEGLLARWIWQLVTVVVVIGGMAFGYALFT